MFKVIEVVEAGYCDALGCATYDYYILNKETGEQRVLRDCALFDEEGFDVYDWDTECETL